MRAAFAESCFSRLALLAAVAAGCGGQRLAGDASGPTDAASDELDPSSLHDAPGGPMNDAATPELRAIAVPLDAVLSELSAASSNAVCEALGLWRFRLAAQSCLAFTQSAIVLEPRPLERDRELCATLHICRSPEHPSPPCQILPSSCTATLRELDSCILQRELWLTAVPSCDVMTRETAAQTVGPPDSPACQELASTCAM